MCASCHVVEVFDRSKLKSKKADIMTMIVKQTHKRLGIQKYLLDPWTRFSPIPDHTVWWFVQMPKVLCQTDIYTIACAHGTARSAT